MDVIAFSVSITSRAFQMFQAADSAYKKYKLSQEFGRSTQALQVKLRI
jgi:hypothetical protein